MFTINGNPLTFKNSTVVVTPVTVNGMAANATNNAPINIVVESGSHDGDATEVECDTNIFGRLVVSGNAKHEIEMSAYISQANLTAPLSPGTSWPMTFGDYLSANITAGMVNIVGTFMISKMGTPTFDANEKLNLDMTWASHGNLSVYKAGIVTGNGTASATITE